MSARRLALRLYRLTLRAFPPEHRAVYAADMLHTFEREFDSRADTSGRRRAMAFAIAASIDVIFAGLGDRRRRSSAFGTDRPSMSSMGCDLVHAVRSLTKARGFTFVCVTSLGIGLGTAFTFLGFLRVMIGAPPGITGVGVVELVVIPHDSLRAQVGDWAIDTWLFPDFEEIRNAGTGLTIVGWTTGERVVRLPEGAAVRLDTMYASPDSSVRSECRWSGGAASIHASRSPSPR